MLFMHSDFGFSKALVFEMVVAMYIFKLSEKSGFEVFPLKQVDSTISSST